MLVILTKNTHQAKGFEEWQTVVVSWQGWVDCSNTINCTFRRYGKIFKLNTITSLLLLVIVDT